MEIIARYKAEYDIFKDKEEIRILKYPNGKYYIHYGWVEKWQQGIHIAGGFESIDEAEKTMMKHRPTAVRLENKEMENTELLRMLEYFKRKQNDALTAFESLKNTDDEKSNYCKGKYDAYSEIVEFLQEE